MRLRTPAAFLLTLGVLGGGLSLGIESSLYAFSSGRDAYAGLDTLARSLSHVEEHYIEEVPLQDLVYAAIDGMTQSLDKHSKFFDPEEYKRLKEDNEGNYFGVGVQVKPHPEGGLSVVGVFDGGPAAQAGIQIEDHIFAVDGADVRAKNTDEIVGLIRGKRGEAVTLGIQRQDTQLDITVIRDAVHTSAIHIEDIGRGIAYVHVSQFQKDTTLELNQALHAQQETTGRKISGLVLDLRNNPGGLLEEAANMVDLFVQEGTIVTTVGRSLEAEDSYSATAGVDRSSLDLSEDESWEALSPIVVLINGESASASEIVSGALQDLGRATVIGEKSYGKGSVQSLFDYPDRTGMKITIGRYQLPSGRFIEAEGGVHPDETVAYFKADHAEDALRNELLSLELEWSKYQEIVELLDQIHPNDHQAPAHQFRAPVEKRLKWDAQLTRALELVRSPQ